MESDKNLYSACVFPEESSVAIKKMNLMSIYIFDSNEDKWFEETNIEKFHTANYLVFKFTHETKPDTQKESNPGNKANPKNNEKDFEQLQADLDPKSKDNNNKKNTNIQQHNDN